MQKKRLLIFTAIIYIIGVTIHLIYSYHDGKSKLYESIERQLGWAATGGALILGEDYHDKAVDKDSLTKNEYIKLANRLTKYNDKLGTDYIYSFVLKDNKIYYTSTSYKEDEFENTFDEFYAHYEEASKKLIDSFKNGETFFETTIDKWGHFKSILIPLKSANGTTYVMGADLEISYINSDLNQLILKNILTAIFFFALLIPSAILFNREFEKDKQRMEKLNEVLESKVKERTKELYSKNEVLLQAQKKITDNINFSAMIQNSILPLQNPIDEFFSEHFIIWEPKDIVGGDIYQFEEFEDGCLVIVADCMGHGVTGAFMTMIAKTALSSIINPTNYKNPALILSLLNVKIKTLLKQDRKDSVSNTGLDAAIAFYDKKNQKLIFASAKTLLFYIQDKKLEVINGDKHSIGYKRSKKDFIFTNYEIKIDRETYFYITTDGIIDQCRERDKLPFGKEKLKDILLKNHQDNFSNQKDDILYELRNYQENHERNDDITMFGFKIEQRVSN